MTLQCVNKNLEKPNHIRKIDDITVMGNDSYLVANKILSMVK